MTVMGERRRTGRKAFRLEPELADRLAEVAHREDRSEASVVRHALRLYVAAKERRLELEGERVNV